MSEFIATRVAFGDAVTEFAKDNKDIIVMDADLSKATMSCRFQQTVPERFINMGIAEADLISTAAGLASAGKIPFACTFAVFAAGRAFEQIRNSVAYPRLNVKVCGSHGGVSVGPDGATHQSVEDLALMNILPEMVVINPCDAVEMRAAVKAMIEYDGPVYLRLGRSPVPVIFDEKTYKFEIGKAVKMVQGSDVTLVATGSLLGVALQAAKELEKEGIKAEVLNYPTIKPLDKQTVIDSAKKTGKVIVLEEGLVSGGLGTAVAQTLSENNPVPMRFIGMQDCFGQSGDAAELMDYYGMSVENTIAKVKELL